jgi:hypothetical protein
MVLLNRSLQTSAIFALLGTVVAHGDPAPFDLAGPNFDVTVTRGAKTLPISEVPNLAVGDRLWIQADLPATQSAHYVMVAAFLRGATNPPPESWFFRCETWTPKCVQEGLTVTVPQDAQQLLVFLAPQTGGDFKTLVSAVRGRPGAFVRTSQDLNQAALDRARLESYLSAIRALNDSDPTKLKATAPLLARSLAIKVDDKCLDRIPQLQAPCLMQGQNSLILDDGHSTSIVEALTAGPAGDLAMDASFTPQLNNGYYSPYIASVLDIARILDSFHTAQYQYIPALISPHGERLTLTLNSPPSFHNPKSVLVLALPAVEQPQLPPLHAVDPKEIYCAKAATLALPVEGAPLVFSTSYAHDITLSLSGKNGKRIDLPARADPEQGGFVVDTSGPGIASLGDSIHGSLRGFWGFDKYEGPGFDLTNAHTQTWELAPRDAGALIVGREDVVHLQAASVSCVDGIMLKDPDGKELKADWKTVKPNEVEVKLPLQAAKPGSITLLVTQYGASQPQSVQLNAFSEVARLDRFSIHAGDAQGILKGSRLDEVASLLVNDVEFLPGQLATIEGSDELAAVAQDARAAAVLTQGDAAKAKVTLKDGRVINISAVVEAPRPSVTLIGKSVRASPSSADSNIQLSNPDELPQDAKLTFSLRAKLPKLFTHDEKIEVATRDESSSTTLSFSNGGITLEDARVAVATLDPKKAFGPSAFGPLQFRIVSDGVTGNWEPLATLVRLPVLRELDCPATPELACKLSGSNLYLVNSVSNDPQFDHPVQVPDGFPGYALPVPHPTNGQLYVKLRDDPSVINPATVATRQLPPSSNEADRGLAKPAASNAEHQTGGNFGGKEPAATGSSSQNTPAQPAPSSQAAPAQAAQLQQTGPKSIPQNEAVTHAADPPAVPDQQK